MNAQIETITQPVREFIKNANDRLPELAEKVSDRINQTITRTLDQGSERLSKDVVERSQHIFDGAVQRTRTATINWERAVLTGVERALGQATEKAPKAELLGRALERISELRDEAERRAVAGGSLPLPLADYDSLNAKAAIKALDELSASDRALIAAYEAAHKNRKTVLKACQA